MGTPNSTITIRVEPSLKQQFDELCEDFGLSVTAAFNMFMKTVVRERKIPFEIKSQSNEITPELQKKIDAARKEYREGKTISCKNHEELQAFLDSL